MKGELENAKTEVQGIHYSRYIASWHNCGGSYYGSRFEEWLKANHCTDEEIRNIVIMAITGKMELERGRDEFVGAAEYIEHE